MAVAWARTAGFGRPQTPLPGHDHPENDHCAKTLALGCDDADAAFPSSAEIITTLRNCASGLKQTCKDAESDFLDLGARLQTIHADADQLTRSVVDALSTNSNETIQSALRFIQAHSKEAMQELDRRRTKLAEDIAGLKTIQGDLGALADQNKNFRQIAKNLKIVGLNISIESARSDDAKVTFQTLAEEITGLAQTVHSVAGLTREDTDAARQTIDAIQTEIGGHMRHLEQLLTSAETMVVTAMAEVDRLMSMSMTVLDGIGAKAAEIREQVSRLVVGIQIHDNISQRVAHIDSSIDEALDILDTACAIELPPPAIKAVLGRMYGINRLQSAHLKTIVEDVAEVGRQSESALESLLTAVEAVAQPEGLYLSASESTCRLDASGARYPVAMLRKALEQLLALFDEGRGHIERLNTAREQTGRTVARMGEHIDKVRDINFEIHLKALNGVVKSSRLGHTGKAIEAIVNEMKELAEQSNATIRTVADIMQDIASASEGMDRNGGDDQEDADQAGCLLRQDINGFGAACDVFKKQSREALAMGEALREKIAQSRAKSEFIEKIAADCNRHFAGLIKLGDLLEPYADAANEEWMEEEKSIHVCYTMQRERDAHQQALLGPKGVDPVERFSTGAGEIDSGAAPMEEFEENVELF